jgi:hypothetical protein
MKKDHPPELSTSQSFIETSSNMTGRQLFEKERKSDINATVSNRREESSEGGPHAAVYQTVLKDMWDEEPDKEEYEKRAKELTADIPQ